MADRRLLDQSLREMAGNPAQIEAIQEKGHCVVLAGPGSGKTRTLTVAMGRALLEDVQEPRGIACITYNNECAIELETRLGQISIEHGERVFIGTVHSFAFSQIILPYARAVFPGIGALKPATRAQASAAVTTAYRQVFNDGRNPKDTWDEAVKKRKRDVDRRSPLWMGQNSELARLVEAYEEELRRQGLVDFDDMPLMALRMVKEQEWIRDSIKAKFPVLFVDEYQDLGVALHELVLELCFRANIRLFAVGDPDQSIYRFTGADPRLLQELTRRDDVKTILLPFNYRCGTSIIEASKAALGEDRAYRAPDGAHKGNVIFDPVDGDLDAQVEHIMGTLIPALTASGVPLEEIAILYRTAYQGNSLADAADSHGIPYVRADNQALVPRNNRLSRLIEASAIWVTGGWREATPPFRRLASAAVNFVHASGASNEERHAITTELAAYLHITRDSNPSTNKWFRGFRDTLITPWRARSPDPGDDWDVIEQMLRRTDPTQGGDDMPLNHFSGRVGETGRLNLSTLHSAKGREFDAVILFDMNKGAMPNARDQQGRDQFREARRLFYVGVTRARKELRLVFRRRNYSPWVADLYRRIKQGEHQG